MTAWLVYLGLFLAPFLQEDAAVIGAASLMSMETGTNPTTAFIVTLLGLTVSDVWKYWAGRLARTQRWAHRFAEKPAVAAAEAKVVGNLGAALMTARFVPGTRIPLYVASGFFKAPFWKFFAFVVASGALYLGLFFAAFEILGAVAGERAKIYLPLIGLAIVLVVVGGPFPKRRLSRAAAARAGDAPQSP